MLQEAYCSFEVSKLLKEKGFDDIDCECHGWIGRSGKHYSADDTFYDDEELKKAQDDRKDYVPLITLQMAMKWLREREKIAYSILVIADGDLGKLRYFYEIQEIDNELLKVNGSIYYNVEDKRYETYEEAAETAISYCLENLI